MKVPDKIYIHPNYEPSGGWITTETREYQPDDIWETEYINKNVILDIIKEQKKIAMGFSYEHLKMIEDKLNSL